MTRTRRFVLSSALVLGLSACDKQRAGSDEPGADDTSLLEGLEPTDAQGNAPGAGKDAQGKDLPKVQDRDPEEEKRKMAQSRQRSGQARKMLEEGKFTEAVTNARAALKIHEQNVDAMLVLGQVFYREGKNELVVSVTTTALAVDEKARTPADTSAVYNLQGFALASLGKDQMATQAFKKAAEADDKNAAAWNNLGTRYLRAGDVATAASCFQYALELQPNFAKAHLNYGAALRGQGKLVEAEAEIRKAMTLQRNYAEAHFNLGVLYLDAPAMGDMSNTQRLQTAIDNLERYKQLSGGRAPSEPLAKGLGSKKRIAPASSDRADDYIRLAKKGIEREERRAQRDAERAAKPGEADEDVGGEPDAEPAAEPGGGDEDDGGEAPDGGDASPAPVKPGGSPPAPVKPGGSPPAPVKPGGSPAAPVKPDDSPAAPKKPSESPAAPEKPSEQPSAPAKPSEEPSQEPPAPAPTAPQKPAPSKPQKPGVQRPGQKTAMAGNPRRQNDTNLGRTTVAAVGSVCAAGFARLAPLQGWT